MRTTHASAAYAVLRRGGAAATRAQTELGLASEAVVHLERMFLSKAEEQRPKFARHDRHVAAAMAQGGFPVLPERRR